MKIPNPWLQLSAWVYPSKGGWFNPNMGKFPFLWDVLSKDYKDKNLKKATMTEIAGKMETSGEFIAIGLMPCVMYMNDVHGMLYIDSRPYIISCSSARTTDPHIPVQCMYISVTSRQHVDEMLQGQNSCCPGVLTKCYRECWRKVDSVHRPLSQLPHLA
jgi:hypothetical protein